jgi:glycosyltransferase involved in cell wall biosynthesis
MAKRIKILFDANPLAKEKSGVGYYLENEVKNLAANYSKELELTGYYFSFLGKGNKPPQITGIKYKPIRIIPRHLRAVFWRLGFRLPLNLLVPSTPLYDVALFTDFVSLPCLGVKCVTIIHDLYFKEHPEYVSAANAKFLQRFVPKSIKESDHIITISLFARDRMTNLFKINKEKISIAPPGPNVNQPSIDKKHGNILLYMGTIEPRKNLVNLLRAYELLPKNLQQKHPFKLAGGKGWKDESIFKEITRLQNKKVPIEYLGYISQEVKAKLYDSAKAIALVSSYEGFGMQILEAMTVGKPLLLSDIPVFREVAGESAFYCNPHSVKSIAFGLQSVLEIKSPAKTKDYPTVLEKYSWRNSAASIYEALLNVSKG